MIEMNTCIYCKSNNTTIARKIGASETYGIKFTVYVGIVTCIDCGHIVEQIIVEATDKEFVTGSGSAWENFK